MHRTAFTKCKCTELRAALRAISVSDWQHFFVTITYASVACDWDCPVRDTAWLYDYSIKPFTIGICAPKRLATIYKVLFSASLKVTVFNDILLLHAAVHFSRQ